MPTGNYGTIRAANPNINDIEILYSFRADRGSTATPYKKLSSSDLITTPSFDTDIFSVSGAYDLRLPSTIFNQKGIYSLIVRPKELKTSLVDCGVLAARPDIRGVVFDLSKISTQDLGRFENNSLVGYRMGYFFPLEPNNLMPNLNRIITSNFRVEPITENLSNINQKSIKYRANDNSSLVFATVTPSSAFTLKPNVLPFIGQPNQNVLLSANSFDPFMMEINITEHDVDTLAIGIFGNQTKNLKNGVRTYYDSNDNIYKQFTEYVIKDTFGNESIYEVREEKDDVDLNENFEQIVQQ